MLNNSGLIISVVCVFGIVSFTFILNFLRFGTMPARVNYFNGHVMNGHRWLSIYWRKRIQRCLEKDPQFLDDFLNNIKVDFIDQFDIKQVIEIGRDKQSISWAANNYEIAERKNLPDITALLKEAGRWIMSEKSLQTILAKKGVLQYKTFLTDVEFPYIRELLSQENSIVALEELAQEIYCSSVEFHPLIDEREIEILQNYTCFSPGNDFAIFKQLSINSPVWKYWIKRFTEFVDGLSLPIANGEDLLRLAYDNRLLKEPALIILQKFVPDFGETFIDDWLSCFADEPEYIALFAERITILYAKAEIEELAEKYQRYSEIPQIKNVFDLLMNFVVDKTPYSEIKDLWLKLPRFSEAWETAAHKFWMDESGGGQTEL